MTKKNKLSSQKRLAIAGFFAISIALLFMISSVPATAGTGHSQTETDFTSTVNYTPNPQMSSNITWSTFNSTWGELEYNNGKAQNNLSAQPNPSAPNPISINPADMISKGTLQNNEVGSTIWNSKKPSYGSTPSGGATTTAGNYTIGGVNEPYFTMNTTAKASNLETLDTLPTVQLSQLPSNNPQYDYITYGAYLTGNALTGVSAHLNIYNGTELYTISNTTIAPGQALYISKNLAEINKQTGGGFNLTGKHSLTNLQFQMVMSLPTSTADNTYNLRTYALAITSYPLTLGQNATGKQISQSIGNAQLSAFKPTTTTTIYNNGYTVSTIQKLQNITISETSTNNGIYTEEATYQGILRLPNEPDLTYSDSYITLKMNMTGKQFIVANLNGISYSSQIQTKTNGTFNFGTVNPNNQNTVIIEVEYTSAQWTSSSGVPSFWTIQGIEYYWYIFLGGALGLIGLGTGLSKHAESLRVGKK